jgi:hypothetical protein
MPACCVYTRPNGQPCRADALPDSPLCLFHDPRHQDTLAAARSKGGAARNAAGPRGGKRRRPAACLLPGASIAPRLRAQELRSPSLT